MHNTNNINIAVRIRPWLAPSPNEFFFFAPSTPTWTTTRSSFIPFYSKLGVQFSSPRHHFSFRSFTFALSAATAFQCMHASLALIYCSEHNTTCIYSQAFSLDPLKAKSHPFKSSKSKQPQYNVSSTSTSTLTINFRLWTWTVNRLNLQNYYWFSTDEFRQLWILEWNKNWKCSETKRLKIFSSRKE